MCDSTQHNQTTALLDSYSFVNNYLALVAPVVPERVAKSDLGDTLVKAEYGEHVVLGRIGAAFDAADRGGQPTSWNALLVRLNAHIRGSRTNDALRARARTRAL